MPPLPVLYIAFFWIHAAPVQQNFPLVLQFLLKLHHLASVLSLYNLVAEGVMFYILLFFPVGLNKIGPSILLCSCFFVLLGQNLPLRDHCCLELRTLVI